MRNKVWLWITLLLAAAALVASAMLLVDYVWPAPVFCDAGGGCAKMKATIFARPLGIPLPAVGLTGMFGVALAALVPGRGARALQAGLAASSGVVAIGLFAVQAMMGVLCPFCAVVDGAAILLAVVSIARWKKGWDPPPGRAVPALATVALVASMGAPLAVGCHGGRAREAVAHAPAPIAAEMNETPKGEITIVDFIDFECPFCRMTHEALVPVLAKHRGQIRLVRKQVPLRMHPHAMDAAKAGICGEELGKGDAMADALFTAPPEALTPEGTERIAKDLGLDADRFRACLAAPATAARIDEDREAFRASKGHGLPTLWIDGIVLEGAQDQASLEAAVDAALRAR